jgi:hypothetical protein
MLVPALIAVVILMAPIVYVIFRKFSFTRQEIEFGTPQDGVAAICLDIQEDSVRTLRIVYRDGTVSEVKDLRAA